MPNPGKCSICGTVGPLTFEHVPPKAAFNDCPLLFTKLQELMRGPQIGDPRLLRKYKQRKGAGAETLCERCNTVTGAWYGNAYADWALQGMRFRYAAPRGSSLHLPFHLLPGRVGKQILCMFASACGPGLFDACHDLRRFVLNRDHVGIPPKYRLFCYLVDVDSRSTRQAGLTGLLDFGQGRNTVFSEIAFPPFGYILSVDSEPMDRELAELTFFTHHAFRDYRAEYLKLPVRAVNSYFPGDFRTAAEWEAALNQAHGPIVA